MSRVCRRPTRASLTAIVALVASWAVSGSLPAFGAEVDGTPVSRTAGLLRAHWDYPAKASLGFGVIVAKLPSSFECRTPCLWEGLTFHGAAGLGGGELSLGYGRVVGETGRGDWLIRREYIGYGLRAAAVRTWGASALDPQGETYLGVEGGFVIAQFGLRLGVFRRAQPIYGEKDWRVFGGAGWEF